MYTRRISWIVALLLCAVTAMAQERAFFRVVSSTNTAITGLTPDGFLTWTTDTPGVTCTVEKATNLLHPNWSASASFQTRTTTVRKKVFATDEQGLMRKAERFSGEYPEPDTVSFEHEGGSVQMTAYPGQVILLFESGTTFASATSIISECGGDVLAQTPVLQLYLVGVPPNAEGQFIDTARAHPEVQVATPNGVLQPDSAHMVQMDEDENHAGLMQEIVNAEGASITEQITITIAGFHSSYQKVGEIISGSPADQTTILLHPLSGGNDNRPLVDYYTNPLIKQTYEQTWLQFFHTLALQSANISKNHPSSDFLIITSAGNAGLNMDTQLGYVRDDSEAKVGLDNILIVQSATDDNYFTDNPHVVNVANSYADLDSSGASAFVSACAGKLSNGWGLQASQVKEVLIHANERDGEVTWEGAVQSAHDLFGILDMDYYCSGLMPFVAEGGGPHGVHVGPYSGMGTIVFYVTDDTVQCPGFGSAPVQDDGSFTITFTYSIATYTLSGVLSDGEISGAMNDNASISTPDGPVWSRLDGTYHCTPTYFLPDFKMPEMPLTPLP